MRRIITKLLQVENLYLKFILTVIAIALIVIADQLSNNINTTVEIINGSVGLRGPVEISGEVDTYEQNIIIGRKLNHYNP